MLHRPASFRPMRLRLTASAALLVILLTGCGGSQKTTTKTVTTQGPPVLGRPAPKAEAKQAAQDLGFPGFATKNTTRVGGADPIAGRVGDRVRATHARRVLRRKAREAEVLRGLLGLRLGRRAPEHRRTLRGDRLGGRLLRAAAPGQQDYEQGGGGGQPKAHRPEASGPVQHFGSSG